MAIRYEYQGNTTTRTFSRQSHGGYFDEPDYTRGKWLGWVLLALFVALVAITFTPDSVLMEIFK